LHVRLDRFQEACKKYGVPELDIFQTTDLSERKDIAAVTATIFALGRTVSFQIIFSILAFSPVYLSPSMTLLPAGFGHSFIV
jgi:hypothetical protein